DVTKSDIDAAEHRWQQHQQRRDRDSAMFGTEQQNDSDDAKRDERHRCFEKEDDWKVVPPAVAAVLAEEEGGMAGVRVIVHELQAGDELRRRKVVHDDEMRRAMKRLEQTIDESVWNRRPAGHRVVSAASRIR